MNRQIGKIVVVAGGGSGIGRATLGCSPTRERPSSPSVLHAQDDMEHSPSTIRHMSPIDEPAGGRKRAVLVGAGHAHLDTIRRAAEFTAGGFELVLIAPGPFWYSGLATGMVGGLYPPDLDRIDVGPLVARGGGRFLQDRATAIDIEARMVRLEAGPPVRYDVASLNLGSEVADKAVPGLAEYGYLVKPIGRLWDLRRDVEGRLRGATAERPVRVVIVGGGATACEVAGNLRRLADDRGGAARITILAAGERVLDTLPARAAEKVGRNLRRRGVAIAPHSAVARVEDGVAVTADGRRVPFDVLVGAPGLRPSSLVGSTGLPTDAEGALLVDESLRSVAEPSVLGGGDCVSPAGRPLPRIGVYAVREGPILTHNLLAALRGDPPRRFRPQRRYLLIMNLGDGTGLATWGPFSWHGRWPFRLKDQIDRRFLARSRAPAP